MVRSILLATAGVYGGQFPAATFAPGDDKFRFELRILPIGSSTCHRLYSLMLGPGQSRYALDPRCVVSGVIAATSQNSSNEARSSHEYPRDATLLGVLLGPQVVGMA